MKWKHPVLKVLETKKYHLDNDLQLMVDPFSWKTWCLFWGDKSTIADQISFWEYDMLSSRDWILFPWNFDAIVGDLIYSKHAGYLGI